MNRLRRSLCVLTISVCTMYNSNAQNPNWTIPNEQYNPGGGVTSLPQSPIDPITNQPGNPDNSYYGQPSERTHAGYTGPDGELMLFSVDHLVYDGKGWLVGILTDYYDNKGGYSEKLILPMGNDCRRFAIIYSSSAASDDIFVTPLGAQNLYMAIYDMDAPNLYSPGIGTIEEIGLGTSLADISKRDGVLHGTTATPLYGYKGTTSRLGYTNSYQIAASELIDNCYYNVYISDGPNLIHYRLTTDDLEYQGVVASLWSETSNAIRSEMELIKLSNGNYRIAIPAVDFGNANPGGYSVEIFDLNPTTGAVLSGSYQQIPMFKDAQGVAAEPYGIEFNDSGRYLYITHSANANLPNALDVWDVQTSQFVNIPTLSGINNYRKSYIERFGSELYLASDNYIGRLTFVNSPGSLVFASTFLAITSGYGNAAGIASSSLAYPLVFRYTLPEQLDMPYPDLSAMSCDCCSRIESDATTFVATGTQTWTENFNPFNGGTGAEVRIYDELIIAPGANITIDGMIFKFDPEARVVVQKGNGTENGGILRLRNSTIFTADLTCKDGTGFTSCGIPDDDESCDRDFWQGVVVEGQVGFSQSTSGITRQGRFFMQSNSMIEYARTAVLVGNNANSTDGGGVLRISDSRFKDNINGIYFRPYVRTSGGQEIYTLSQIWMNDFYTTADFLTLSPAIPGKHIDVRDLSGLTLNANTFENQIAPSFSNNQRGTGLYIVNSRVKDSWFCTGTIMQNCVGGTINRSLYKNLSVGIDGLVTVTPQRTVYIYHANFDNNILNGIRLSGYVNPEILDSDFYIPSNSSVGLAMAGCTGYVVENNYLEGNRRGIQGIGMLIQSSGTTDNFIYRNTFEALSEGIITQGTNGKAPNFDVGLQFQCNTFDQPIRIHDIHLASGNVSDEQGTCNGQTTGPARNLFSHSHTSFSGHHDWRVNTSAVFPPNLEIVYRHHSPLTNPTAQRLMPVVYTIGQYNYVQPVACSIAYQGYSASCPVQSTSLPIGLNELMGGGYEGETYSTSYISEQATSFNEAIAEAEAYLDGGHTWEILALIEANDSPDVIASLVAEAGESMSGTVLKSLQKSSNDEISSLAADALTNLEISITEDEGSFFVELPSSEIEQTWKANRAERDAFWVAATRFAMQDTLGLLLHSDLTELANEYEAQGISRYVASNTLASGDAIQSWVNDSNNPTVVNWGEAALPSASDDASLPADIPNHFEMSTFDMYGNTVALNALYGEEGSSYNFYSVPFIDDLDLPKSNESGDETADKAMESSVFRVQPNPFKDELSFIKSGDLATDKMVRVELYDLLGRLVHSQSQGGDSGSLVVNESRLPKGMLTYIIYVDEVPTQKGKVIRL